MELKTQYGLYTVKKHLDVGDERACCLASDPFLGSDVLLQLVTLPDPCDELQQQNFLQRLEQLAELTHPALAPIFDLGHEQNTFFYTTAFYPRGRFNQSKEGVFEEKEGLRVIRQLAEGLIYAHSKGFEHGMLTGDDIFADEEGRPVLSNFGVAELLAGLYTDADGSEIPSQVPSLAQKQSSYGLGELFLTLVLTEEEQTPLIDRVFKLQGYREKELISALLGLSQDGIPSYDELVRWIDEILSPAQGQTHEPAPKGSSSDDVDFSSLLEENGVPEPFPVELPASSAPQSETAVSAVEEVDSEKQSLREEQSRLHEQLQEAVEAHKQTELELAKTLEDLEETQALLKRAKRDKNVALEMLDNQPPQRHPATWLVGGCLVGMLAAGSLVYALQNTWLMPQQKPVVHKLSVERSSILPAAVTGGKKKQPDLPDTAATEPSVAQSTVPEVQGEAAAVPAAEKGQPQTETEAAVTTREPLSPSAIPAAAATKEQLHEQGPPNTVKTSVLAVVDVWGQVWSNQDLQAYFACYSEDYQPDAGQSLEEWRESRTLRLSRPAWIEIDLQYLDFKLAGPDMAEVTLLQKYRSDSYGDQTKKVLSLVREKNKWKIWMERSLS